MPSATPAFARATRAVINKSNAQPSTGPRTTAGKQRSSQNALRHGLTAASPVLPSEDPAAFKAHHDALTGEYQPATPTEVQLVRELADTSWRLNRIPLLEAEVLNRAANPPHALAPDENLSMTFDIVDAHRLINNLSILSQRLSRQFHKTLDQLRQIQADRRDRDRRDLREAAGLLEFHRFKGKPFHPAEHGFVFSKDKVERAAHKIRCLNYVHFRAARTGPSLRRAPLDSPALEMLA